MKIISVFIALLISLIFTGQNLYAKIVVEATKGEAAYKQGNQWLPLTKGQPLEEGAKISTGAKSWVLLNIDGDSVKVNQLTMMKIFRNRLSAGTKDTNIGLKHGSLKARIGKIGTLKTNFKITTPVATSSVRGTEEFNKNGAKSGNFVHAPAGTLTVEDRNGGSYSLTGNSAFNIGPNDPRPQNLLFNLSGRSLIRLINPNSTDTEKGSAEFSGFDAFTGNDNPVGSTQRNSAGPSSVNLQIEW
ncbi:MAG: FecR family protein [Spirochaetota bacterium]